MTAPSASARIGRLRPQDAPALTDQLERDPRFGGPLANQHLLDALDHGEHGRFLVWPEHDPVSVVYLAPHGTVVPSGDPTGGAALAAAVERSGWRVMIGDAPLCRSLLGGNGRGLFRRRATAREQRFMVARARAPAAALAAELGLRRAESRDVEVLTAFAAQLHVEDRMGPPLSRTGVSALRSRMIESVSRGASWVIERKSRPVAKIDVSLRSPLRGAQIAGVYVDAAWRSQGIATAGVATVASQLLDEGLPGVSLHVRDDNAPALRAYARSGFQAQGVWLLALR